ncbi:hypothetical protein [Lentilitoribacter sp. Alg239-R112]|uniref:hypothetical protein n=1 Tax=Lentilitoribacter sp. Alg239-R112 TaxID=2305987 RepID=UPI0013A6BB49|nr:hypothetical protein [Lentilitoribacter sp. Alg239-R112]
MDEISSINRLEQLFLEGVSFANPLNCVPAWLPNIFAFVGNTVGIGGSEDNCGAFDLFDTLHRPKNWSFGY